MHACMYVCIYVYNQRMYACMYAYVHAWMHTGTLLDTLSLNTRSEPRACSCKGADKSHDGILDFYELLAPGTSLGIQVFGV